MPEISSNRPPRDDGFVHPRRRVLLLTLTMASSLGMVASTIYVPSIPTIASALETSIARVQFTFVGYLLAFALGMLVLGPLSDRYGRRQTIIGGLVLSALSSLACALSPTIELLIAARVVQGVGACAGLVVFGIRPEDYGFYASLPPIGFLVGSFLSNRLTQRLGIDGLIAIGCLVLIPAGSTMVTLALLGVTSPYAIIAPMILICCGSGLMTPNATAGSLGVNAGIIGTAAGLGSFMQMTGAAGATAALSLGPSGSPLMLASVIALAGVFAVTAFGALMQYEPRAREGVA